MPTQTPTGGGKTIRGEERRSGGGEAKKKTYGVLMEPSG